jgi:hypothetical protein
MALLPNLANKAKARAGQLYDQIIMIDGGKSYQTRQVSRPTVQVTPNQFIPYADPTQAMVPGQRALAADTSYGHALQTVGTQWGLGGLRSLTGQLQGVSGIYDLMTPGDGTNRISQGLDRFAHTTDQTAHNEAQAGSPTHSGQHALDWAYKGGQLGTDALSTALSGAGIEAAGHATPLLSRLSGMGVNTLRPANLANITAQTGLDVGAEASKGRPITLEDALLSGGSNLAMNSGLPAASYGVHQGAQAAKPMLRQGVNAIADAFLQAAHEMGHHATNTAAGALNIKPNRKIPDSVLQAAQRVRDAQLGQNDGDVMDIHPDDMAVYNGLHTYLGTNVNDPTVIDKLIRDRRVWREEGRGRVNQETNAIKGVR